MLQYLVSHWQTIALAVLAVAEVVALFVPGAQGTVKTLVSALTGVGVKDPGVGGL
jgi:hypothetical protein